MAQVYRTGNGAGQAYYTQTNSAYSAPHITRLAAARLSMSRWYNSAHTTLVIESVGVGLSVGSVILAILLLNCI